MNKKNNFVNIARIEKNSPELILYNLDDVYQEFKDIVGDDKNVDFEFFLNAIFDKLHFY